MKLENGYKIIYEAPKRVTVEKPNKLYASKALPSADDSMIIAYNNGETQISLKDYKLIYDDGKHLWGSTSRIPSSSDVNIVLKIGSEIVFGEVITPAVTAVPVVKMASATKKSKAKAEQQEETAQEEQ